MGDISEMRALIVLFTIVTVTIALVGFIDTRFFTSNVQNKNTPNIEKITSFLAWNDTYTLNVTFTGGGDQTFSLSGYNMAINWDASPTRLTMGTYAQFWFVVWDWQPFEWYNNDVLVSETYGIVSVPVVMMAETVDEYVSGGVAEFEIRNTYTKFEIVCAYNTTAYDSWDEAVLDDGAVIIFNQQWEDRPTSLNALQLVGMILTGSLPEIHPVLSVLFGLVGWGIIAAGVYLTFIFILRIIGSVFGGGGA